MQSTPALLNTLQFLVFEATAFMACWQATGFLLRSERNTGPLERALTALLGYIVFPALYSQALTGLRANSPLAYLIPTLLCWAFVYVKGTRKQFACVACDEHFPSRRAVVTVVTVAISILLLCGLFARLIDEIDSLGAVHDIYNWADNKQGPGKSFFGYVTAWEMRHVPLVVLTGEISSAWILGVVPVLGILLSCIGLASVLQLPKIMALPYGLAATCLLHFWAPGPSGVFTLKNDTTYNLAILAGTFVLMTVATHGWTRLRAWCLGLATGLVCIKYSGVLIGASWLAVIAYCHLLMGLPFRSLRLSVLLPLVLLPVAISLHHFLRNIIVYSNPFFPIQVAAFGYTLPGTVTLDGTSILDGSSDPEIWRLLFVSNGWRHPLGPWFGLTAAVLAWWFPLFSWHGVVTTWRRSRTELPWILVGLLAAFYWYTYFRSYWSASAQPGDYTYLRTLSSIRYATAAVVLTELWFLRVIWKAVASQAVVAFIAVAMLVYRLALLGLALPDHRTVDLSRLLDRGLPAIFLTATIFACFVKRIRYKAAFAALALLGAITLVTEKSITVHEGWAKLWSPLIDRLYEAPSQDVIQLVGTCPSIDGVWLDPLAAFYAQGRVRQHHLITQDVSVPHSDIAASLTRTSFLCCAAREPLPLATREFVRALSADRLITVVDSCDRAEVLRAVPELARSATELDNDSRIVVVTGRTLPEPKSVSEVGPRYAEQRMWREGACFAFGEPAEVFHIAGDILYRVRCQAGDTFLLDEFGDATHSGIKARIVWDGDRWRLPIPSGVRIIDGSTALGDLRLSAPDLSGVQGTYDAEKNIATITMLMPMPWAIWSVPGLQLPTAHEVTVRVRLRTNAGSRCNTHWFDYDADRVVNSSQVAARVSMDWQSLTMVITPSGSSSRDYVGIGLAGCAPGDQVDIASIEFLHGHWNVPGVE